MASVLPYTSVYRPVKATAITIQRPTTRGTIGTTDPTGTTTSSSSTLSNGMELKRTASLSSFPSSRSLIEMARRPSRTPNPQRIEADRSSNPSSKTLSSRDGTSSQHSSLSPPRKYNSEAHSHRKLRSQYPRGSTENHVEYILVASFDIDRGPIMEHQYPIEITGDEHMLAELMLPDGAHMRNQDWTIFFLHKDTSQEEEEAERKAERRRRRQRLKDKAAGLLDPNDVQPGDEEPEGEGENGEEDDEDEDSGSESEESEPEGGQGPPLIYVLNLVNTKQDETAKRGAVPLLLLALEEYFKAPHPSTLSMLYEAVNNMDLSLMPRLTLLERYLLQASDNKDLFVEKFEQMIQMRMAEDRGEVVDGPGILDSPERRGDVSLTRIGTKAHVQNHSTYSVPRDTHEFETKVMYNDIPIPIKVPVAISPETVGDFSLIKLIQTFAEPHAKSPQPFALHPHLTTGGAFTHPIIVLTNAMLTQKRVIFLGHNRPSGEVAEAVLAACALASGGILRGFTRHAFPYTDLTKIDDLLKVPGFIAGVTNPTFEHHHEWWDLICDLPTGRMKISSKIDPAPITEGLVNFQQQYPLYANAANIGASNSHVQGDPTGDAAFMNDVLRSIVARHGEGVIRAKWRDWVEKFTRVAAAFEETVYGASALHIGVPEIEAENKNIGGHGYVWSDEGAKLKELAGGDLAQLYTLRPVKSIDLHHLHDRLRTQKLTPQQSKEIYLALEQYTHTYDEVCQLLTAAPESHAGLFYIALGLFHKDKEVRMKVVDILERISEHEAGRHWWGALSGFQKLAFFRIKREIESEFKSRDGDGDGHGDSIDQRLS
ncbi:hypothetical protein B7463_g3114, partial [Scytalidium lignicola]